MASTKIPLELSAYAPDADGATLELQTTDTTVTDGSVLGKIEFKAPKEASGTDAILTAAAIEAVAEGTFAADNNATELVFKLGSSEAATQKMVLTSSGKLGIGTASPSAQVHISDSGQAILRVEGVNQYYTGLMVRNNYSSTQSQWHIAAAGGSSGWGSANGNFIIRDDTTNSTAIEAEIGAGGNPLAALHIDSNSNVGIGTASPDVKLEVESSASASHIVRSKATVADGYRVGFEAQTTHTGGGHYSMFTTNNGDGYFGGDKFVIASETMGDVDANTGTIIKIGNDGSAEFRGSATGLTINRTGDNAWVGFSNNGTYTAFIYGSTNEGMRMFVADGSGGHPERFRIAPNGDLTATDTTIGSNSDQRLKKDIVDFTYDINKFKQYKPKSFNWINKSQHGNRENVKGFMAQEVKSIDDSWIGQIEIDKDSADYNIIPDNISLTSKLGSKDAMYISIIQQLIERIEKLEEA